MDKAAPKTIYLNEYRKLDFRFISTSLDISLGFSDTTITATHQIEKINLEANSIALNYEKMELNSVQIDGVELSTDEYLFSDALLTLFNVPSEFQLTIENSIDPSKNTALSGLYQSGDMLCTQCEAEGFRRITPALDRPDSLSIYQVALTADKINFPITLCNGNLVEEIDNNDGTHTTVWHDPFPKPTYLFAIVAGQLDCMEDKFTTMNGRDVKLKFYARGKDISKCVHAMSSLKKSMVWDEEAYGREYDLDLFNVVAVGDFNMGAMENKSLNIFNTKYVLADQKMATDTDFDNVESVIGHEYFHNWSGNRVTCRDWFQLSLKEGFTVFRDQEFSADMGSRGVKRIGDVNVLRSHQFKEDASPMSHPIRPESYQEINNFYTVTIYNKGAEVVRMLHTLLGSSKFRKGTDLYFDRHDGEAVTTDHFVAAMEDATKMDLTQFKNWYSQSGTPELHFWFEYQPENERFFVTAKQSCPDTPGQTNKQPFVIPVSFSLFDNHGKKLLLDNSNYEKVLVVDKKENRFEFNKIKSQPTPSLLRNFSAPVKIKSQLNPEDLVILLAHDDDPFSRWEAGQSLYLTQIQENLKNLETDSPTQIDDNLSQVFTQVITRQTTDQAYLAKIISLPTSAYISEFTDPIDPKLISQARDSLQLALCESNSEILIQKIEQCERINTGGITSEEKNARALRNVCLDYLSMLDNTDYRVICTTLLTHAKCMTDESTAISLIARSQRSDKTELLNQFYDKWKDEPLVIDKWLRAQSTANCLETLDIVESLTHHPGFDKTNPNKVYSLILGFTHGNPVCFHSEDGSGYDFLLRWIKELDAINPQVASRLVSALNGWGKYTPLLRGKMKTTLESVASIHNLSPDVAEIVSKNLTLARPVVNEVDSF